MVRMKYRAEIVSDTDVTLPGPLAPFLDGTVVVDVSGAPAALAGRILADLGATVYKVRVDGLDPGAACWSANSRPAGLDTAPWGDAAVVLETPYEAGAPALDRSVAPGAVWVSVTPFGVDGPRAHWHASDIGVMAASGNLWATGDADRPPVRCAMPVSYAHTGPEAVVAALTALWAGGAASVDLSMQEAVLIANMATPARFPWTGFRGQRRGADIGRTQEIWPTKDGWVSFGLRGGKARVPSLTMIGELAGLPPRDWSTFNHVAATDDELREIETAVREFFATKTMTELYELACETNLMLAPVNSPAEIVASAQLASRTFFGQVGGVSPAPKTWVRVVEDTRQPTRRYDDTPAAMPLGAWSGVKILELGSGAAGPIATRYFAEHGATVIRIESRSRPDFLRTYALGPNNPHGLEGSTMFDGLNCGKQSVALNLKHPDAVALAKRLVSWADAVAENFAPRAMKGFGLDYETLAAENPGLVMLSTCLNGQTGPHRDYPGFGGQGAALSGFNFLTGWPDRAPVGPHGTITDSLSPRYGAAVLAAALLRKRRTGQGCHLDLSQVEAAVFSLAPWITEYVAHNRIVERMGNRSLTTAPHGVYPAAGDDRWIVVAAHDDAMWARLAAVIGVDDPALSTAAQRLARVDDVDGFVAAWTRTRPALEAAELLQAAGVEAIPVADFGDVHDDPQLTGRGHFQPLDHPVLGPGLYEHSAFRINGRPAKYDRPGPTIGQHNVDVLCGILGLSESEVAALQSSGAVE
jgi:crotonobetainyl-CoA:carnitine CoA-transferase CaiB-like acyl-CoA transferase